MHTRNALGSPIHPLRDTAPYFEELATLAHDMELSIANHGVKKDIIIDQQRERHNEKASDKNSIKLI